MPRAARVLVPGRVRDVPDEPQRLLDAGRGVAGAREDRMGRLQRGVVVEEVGELGHGAFAAGPGLARHGAGRRGIGGP